MKARWKTASSSRTGGGTVRNSLAAPSSTPTVTSFSSLPAENCLTDAKTAQKCFKTWLSRALLATFLLLFLLFSPPCSAQVSASTDVQVPETPADSANNDTDPTVFPHPNGWPFYI